MPRWRGQGRCSTCRARTWKRARPGHKKTARSSPTRAVLPEQTWSLLQGHLDAAGLGVVAGAGDGLGLLQLDLVVGDAGRLERGAHGQRTLLAQLLVHRRVAGRVGVAAD